MANRGRGASNSLTHEQQQTLGLFGKDKSAIVTAPPPTYPPLRTKPLPLQNTAARQKELLYKERIQKGFQTSVYNLGSLEDGKDVLTKVTK